MSMKNPMTLAGIEPATFRFVTQHLNHCATADVSKYSFETVVFCSHILSVVMTEPPHRRGTLDYLFSINCVARINPPPPRKEYKISFFEPEGKNTLDRRKCKGEDIFKMDIKEADCVLNVFGLWWVTAIGCIRCEESAGRLSNR